ncbi:MAG: IS1 family transposase, partial [Oscillospiraceae bacterium]|nr:IS1 family transposase [Oscillospiraceae bacterium]
YATDGWKSYNLIDPMKRIIGKAHTYTVERMNRLLRHYLARFARKTYCWSRSLKMIENSVLLFMCRDLFKYVLV